MRMRQYGRLKGHRDCHRGIFVNCLRSVPAAAGRFLELNDVYWAVALERTVFPFVKQ